MKAIYLTLFTLLLIIESKGQGYHSMLGKTNSWISSILSYNTEGDQIQGNLHTYTQGDSIINRLAYKKVFTQMDYYFKGLQSGYIGLMREDTAKRKVYFWSRDSVQEICIYDFSLKLADSIYLLFDGSQSSNLEVHSDKYGVQSVTSFQSNFGYRNELILYNKKYYPDNSLSWLEGIGSQKYPIYIYGPDISVLKRGMAKLTCYVKDDSMILGTNTDCTSAIEQIQSTNAKISGYLSENTLNLFCTGSTFQENSSVSFYNTNGQCLGNYKLMLQEGTHESISLQKNLSKGIYIVTIQSGSKQVVLKLANF